LHAVRRRHRRGPVGGVACGRDVHLLRRQQTEVTTRPQLRSGTGRSARHSGGTPRRSPEVRRMYAPAQHDEATGLGNYIEQQLTAIRAAALGLTEDQARETPCRSALSVGGIIKHASYVMRTALERLATDVTEQPMDAA